MEVKVNQLSNGIKHIAIPLVDKKSATVLILVGIGSRYENLENNGIAHFIEHMLFKGTQKRPNALLISEEIDTLGADYNAFTSKEYTGFYIKAASSSIGKSIDILSDMIINSTFDSEECEKEKKVIVEEINMYLDTPMRQVGTIFEETIFSPHPLGYDTAGKKETVTQFSRQLLIDFKEQHYVGGNIVIVTSGGLPNNISEMVEAAFSPIKQSSNPSIYQPFLKEQTSPLINIFHKKSDQAHFCIGLRSQAIGHPNRYTMSLFNTIMGGNMSSRLFVELREKRGLCYYVSSDNDAYLDTGEWVIQAGVDVTRIEESLGATLEELVKVKNNGVSETELVKAKQYLKGRLALGLEETKGIANLYGINMLLEQSLRSPAQIEAGIDEVSLSQVNSLALELITKNHFAYALCGPYAKNNSTKLMQIIDNIMN